ncbi:hypothetical protein [Thioclava sp.]|uniref:hypothetical protein n=1 Tax=Thioclava sp. TaxID=1933450 RepID=UPI003AA81C80
MIPNRFATEYPARCLQLLETFEPIAKDRDLFVTFSVMLASSILLVPWERANNRHPLKQEHGGDLQAEIKKLEKQKWQAADFWAGNGLGEWRFSRIMGDPNEARDWPGEGGNPSFSVEENTIQRRSVGDVFRVLRNALAHGNIIYLDESGVETEGTRVQHIAFLSRYEENDEQRAAAETYRLVTVRESDFLPFVRAWAHWVIAHHKRDSELRVA